MTQSAAPSRQRPRMPAPPAEGENGLFSQSWYPLCESREVPPGAVRGYPFLDGRVVVVRGEDGVAQVLSAYCPHLGADLGVGSVVGNTVQCAFHHWRYDRDGRCVATGPGDPPPPNACLFNFPTRERYGLVWAFNGEQPLFDLPGFELPDEELLIHTETYPLEFDVDPWVICCNTPDVQHIRVVHRIRFDSNDPGRAAEWTDHSMLYDAIGTHAHGERVALRVGIYGTTIFYQAGELQGRWFGFLSPMTVPRPGRTRLFVVLAVKKSEPEAAAWLEAVTALERRVVSEDEAILQTIRFQPGTLTGSDRTLARFIDYLRRYPRAHPSRDFIR